MSVIGYSKSEVVEAIASCWARGSAGSSDALRHMEWLAEAGNALLKANDEAYRTAYGEPDGPDADLAAVPITGADIKRALIAQTVDKQLRGWRSLEGFRYNLVSNGGTDFATVQILDLILHLMTSRIRLMELRAK